MVKMLKKQEKAFFEKNIQPRDSRKVKELHLINKNFIATTHSMDNQHENYQTLNKHLIGLKRKMRSKKDSLAL